MKNEIKYPSQITYFICFNENRVDVMSHGSVEPDQWMETGQPIIDTYLVYEDYVDALLDNGINPFEGNTEEL